MMEYTLFGESHGGVVGVVLEHVPAGIPVEDGFIAAQLLRRAPRGAAATARHETDEVAYLSGVFGGKTTGMPLAAVLRSGSPALALAAFRAVALVGEKAPALFMSLKHR